MSNKRIVYVGLISSLICIISPFSLMLPVSPAPISLGTFGVYLAGVILGTKMGVTSVTVYLILGAIGLPIFAGFMGGISRFFAPSGGYLISYILIALLTGYFSDKFYGKKNILIIVGMIIGTLMCYFVGSAYMSYKMGFDISTAFIKGVIPYIIGDTIKMIVAYFISIEIRKRGVVNIEDIK